MSDFTPMRKSREVYIPGPDSDEGRRRKWFEENEEKIRAFEARLLEGAALIEEGMRIVAALEARAEKAEADLAAAREIIADTLTDSMDADAEYWAALRERANIFLKRATERESGAKQECGA